MELFEIRSKVASHVLDIDHDLLKPCSRDSRYGVVLSCYWKWNNRNELQTTETAEPGVLQSRAVTPYKAIGEFRGDDGGDVLLWPNCRVPTNFQPTPRKRSCTTLLQSVLDSISFFFLLLTALALLDNVISNR